MLQMGGGKNMHGCLVTVEHMWNPHCTNFSFPQAVGEDTVNRFQPVAVALHEILYISSRTDFVCSVWRSSVADAGAAL